MALPKLKTGVRATTKPKMMKPKGMKMPKMMTNMMRKMK